MKVLVTRASGYIGRQLAEKLSAANHDVTCMVRSVARTSQLYCPQIKSVEADALQPETLPPALNGIDVAYYLIHSMSGRVDGFELRDRQAARNFAIAAKQSGVRRVIYLGGLAASGSTVSAHLKSRHETGAVLRQFGPPPTTGSTSVNACRKSALYARDITSGGPEQMLVKIQPPT